MMKKLLLLMLSALSMQMTAQESATIRARDLGIPFEGKTGAHNAITDVPGVEVGYTTIIEGEGKIVPGEGPVRTGVTVVLPKGKTDAEYAVGCFVFNGNGEMTGIPFMDDFGSGRGPIGITNTYSVGVVRDAIGDWCFKNFPLAGNHDFRFGLPVVGETFDGGLNDINGLHVKPEHVFAAIDDAHGGSIAEGNVGGGTGMVCYWFKGGTGTASRMVTITGKEYTVGVLVQANFGYRRHLMIRGVPVGEFLSDTLMPEVSQDGSIIAFVGTDAPLTALQLQLIAKRVTLGIARTGTTGSSGSGDIFIAFSTQDISESSNGKIQISALGSRALNPLFTATVEATEEAILNALVAAETMEGINGNVFHALPHEPLKRYFSAYGELFERLNK